MGNKVKRYYIGYIICLIEYKYIMGDKIMTLKRKTEVYKVLILQKSAERGSSIYEVKELEDKIILEEFLNYYFCNYVHSNTNNQKVTLNYKNICYYIDSVEKNTDIKKIKLKYIKFNKNTKVVNIDTLQSKYKKDKKDGDEERQHYIIKTYTNINRAILVYERITGAVSIAMLENHINKAYRKWIKYKYTDRDKEYLLGFEIRICIVPSQDFINELSTMQKISLLRVTVDKEKVTSDEDIIFSEDNVSRDYVDIIYKPIQGLSFSKSKVIKYFKLYKNQTNKKKIKRIVITGRKEGSGISLDTEQMKLSKYIDMQLDTDGLVDSNSIFEKYTKLVNEDFKEYFNELILETALDIDIDIEESEE